MSIKYILSAMEAKVGNSSRKMVLIKLADNANDDGVCYPSYQNIADHCEMTKRSVMTHIKQLEKDGFLSKTERKTEKGNSSNIYKLTIEDGENISPPPSENISPPPVKKFHPPSENISPPSENISPPPSENISPRTCHSFKPVNEPVSETSTEKNKKLNPNRVVEIFNQSLQSLPSVIKLTDDRRRKVNALIKSDLPTEESWIKLFEMVNQSDFLMGRSKDWQCTFDWLIKPGNTLKVAEGTYANKTRMDDMSWAEDL